MTLNRAFYRIISTGSGKGKTLVGERLVGELVKKGVRVAVIKHAAHGVDLQGKDSKRYGEAGAREIVVAAPGETVYIVGESLEDVDLAASLLDPRSFVVIVEGFKKSKRGKKIIVAENPGELDELGCDDKTLAVVSSNPDVIEESGKRGCTAYSLEEIDKLAEKIYMDALKQAESLLPGANCGYCGYSTCRMFAERVIRGEKSIGECPVAMDVRIIVDGKDVPANPYVKKVFAETLRALIATLKGTPSSFEEAIVKVNLKTFSRRSS